MLYLIASPASLALTLTLAAAAVASIRTLWAVGRLVAGRVAGKVVEV